MNNQNRYCKKRLLIKISLFAALCLSNSLVVANEYQSFHRGARTLGMGGAFTAVADDYNAIYFNPAGLSNISSFSLGILNPMVTVSENSKDLFDDFGDIDENDEEQVSDLLKKYVGENNHVQFSTDNYCGFRVGSIGVVVSAIGQGSANIRVRDPVWPKAEIKAVADYGLIAGLGMDVPLLKGLKVGATLKGLSRTSLNEVYTAQDIAEDDFSDMMDNDQKDGTDFSADLGLLYGRDIMNVTKLNLALVGQNIREMGFGDALDAKTQINAGIALQQKFIGCTFTEALDVYDVTDNLEYDDSNEKKVHMGLEVQLPMILSVRAGLNQGYYTAGATLDFKMLKFDFATYGEEIGVISGQKEDRRYVGQISAGWLW